MFNYEHLPAKQQCLSLKKIKNKKSLDITFNLRYSLKFICSLDWILKEMWNVSDTNTTVYVNLSVAPLTLLNMLTPLANRLCWHPPRGNWTDTRAVKHTFNHSHHFALCKSPLSLQREITEINCFLIFTKSPNSLQRAAIFICREAGILLVEKQNRPTGSPALECDVIAPVFFYCHNKRRRAISSIKFYFGKKK